MYIIPIISNKINNYNISKKKKNKNNLFSIIYIFKTKLIFTKNNFLSKKLSLYIKNN